MCGPESSGDRPVSPGVDGLPKVPCQGVGNGTAEENVLKWLSSHEAEVWRFQEMQGKIAGIIYEYMYSGFCGESVSISS